MVDRSGFDRRPDRSDQPSDRASSSQDRSAHPARSRSLLFSCIRPDTWGREQASRNESSTSVELRLLEREMTELANRAKPTLDQRLSNSDKSHLKCHKKLKDIKKKSEKLAEVMQKLEEDHNQ